MADDEPLFRVTPYVDVRGRARELGFEELEDITLLPRNFDTATDRADLVHEATAPTVNVLLRQAGVRGRPLEGPEVELPTLHENDFTWIGPTLFISGALVSQDPHAVTVALNLISNYLHEFFRGTFGSQRVVMSVVVDDPDGGSTKIAYEGPRDGLKDLPRVVREARRRA